MTADMLELFKRNYKSGILITYIDQKDNPNRFSMHQLFITGVDQDIGNILTFAVGFITQKDKYQVNWVLTKFFSEIETLNRQGSIKTIVTDLDKTIIRGVSEAFKDSQIIISHGSIITCF